MDEGIRSSDGAAASDSGADDPAGETSLFDEEGQLEEHPTPRRTESLFSREPIQLTGEFRDRLAAASRYCVASTVTLGLLITSGQGELYDNSIVLSTIWLVCVLINKFASFALQNIYPLAGLGMCWLLQLSSQLWEIHFSLQRMRLSPSCAHIPDELGNFRPAWIIWAAMRDASDYSATIMSKKMTLIFFLKNRHRTKNLLQSIVSSISLPNPPYIAW